MDELREERQSLWLLTFGPAIWFVHFLLSYITVSIWCAKYADEGDGLGPMHVVIGVYTLVAVGIIAFVGFEGYRRHTFGDSTPPHDFDTPADRHRFLGFATLLLCGLSAIATLYVGGSSLAFGSCR